MLALANVSLADVEGWVASATRPATQPAAARARASIEVDVTGEGEVADITIKGEGQTSQNSIRYTNVIKANPALKEYEWVPKVEAPKNGAVPFQIKGTTKKKDDAA
jgi:hypothetical protein